MVYIVCRNLPSSEKYGLISQIQRSAVSIPSNLAEGSKRATTKDFNQFVAIAKGSAAELETQLLLVQDIYGIDISIVLGSLEIVQRMLEKLSQSLKLKPKTNN